MQMQMQMCISGVNQTSAYEDLTGNAYCTDKIVQPVHTVLRSGGGQRTVKLIRSSSVLFERSEREEILSEKMR